jgi:hypothetical protein
MNFRTIARALVERAREDIRADLQAQRYPDAVPVPMLEHLATLPPALPPPDDDPDHDDPDQDDDSRQP